MNKQSKLILGKKPDDPRDVRPATFVNKGKVYPYAGARRMEGRKPKRGK